MTRHGMSEAELRELDVQVHKALYPDATYVKAGLNDGSALSYYVGYVDRGEVVGYPLPRYSTDIGAWDAVCALHPEWRWLQSEVTGDGYVAVVTRLQDHARADESQFFVDNSEYPTSGLDRLARGRARCVIAWAAGRGEG
jgi:hypothetical protein